MSRDKQRLDIYLSHMLEAIRRIDEYTEGMNKSAFVSDTKTVDAVIRNLEIIGEAGHNITKHYPDFASDHSHLPLVPAYEMRNALSHGYFKVDLDLVWTTVNNNLPDLKEQILAVRVPSPSDPEERKFSL